nr:MAG TPA: hypothetical protein [Caudoviricetes sp.]
MVKIFITYFHLTSASGILSILSSVKTEWYERE